MYLMFFMITNMDDFLTKKNGIVPHDPKESNPYDVWLIWSWWWLWSKCNTWRSIKNKPFDNWVYVEIFLPENEENLQQSYRKKRSSELLRLLEHRIFRSNNVQTKCIIFIFFCQINRITWKGINHKKAMITSDVPIPIPKLHHNHCCKIHYFFELFIFNGLECFFISM